MSAMDSKMPTKGSAVQSGSKEPIAADVQLIAAAQQISGQVRKMLKIANKEGTNSFIDFIILEPSR
jgi:hypothetical protein